MAWVDGPLAFVFAGLTLFVLAVLYMVARGTLIPRKTHDERIADYKDQVTVWRQAYGESESARRLQAGQIDQLLVMGRTTEALLKALPVREIR